AQTYGVREVEARVIVDGPGRRLANSLTDLAALLRGLLHDFLRDERRVAAGIGDRGAESAEASLDAGARGLLKASFARATGRVAHDVPARLAPTKLPDRHAERFSLDVPKSQVDCALRVELFAPRRIEVAAVVDLPQMIDAQRVFAHNHLGALLDGIA